MPYEVKETSKKTLRSYETAWGHFVAAAGGSAPATLTTDDVKSIANNLEETFRPTMVALVLRIAKNRYKDAWPKGGVYRISPEDISRPGLTTDEVDRLVRWATSPGCGAVLRGYLAVSTLYGPRSNELRHLSPDDLGPGGETLFLHTSKLGVPRRCWVPEPLRPVLLEAKFRGRTEREISRAFYLLMSNAGVPLRPRLGWHAIRRTLVNALLTDPKQPATLVHKFLRWSGGNIVDVYAEQDGIKTDRTIFERHPFLDMWVRYLGQKG